MEQVILFLLNRIAELVRYALSWKVYGELSVFHFVLGLTLLLVLLNFFRFGSESGISMSIDNANQFRNEENKKSREAYRNSYENYKEIRSRKESYNRRYQEERKGK